MNRSGSSEEFFKMEDVAKKLTLWETRTFRPILTHEELEPIMAAVGFVPLPMSITNANASCFRRPKASFAWREYAFRSESRGDTGDFLPRPRLPFPRIDGLHLLAYQAFFHALDFYLGSHLVPDLFHVRSMTIRAHDNVLEAAYRPMRDCNMDAEGIFVYRDGTLDHITRMICTGSKSENDSGIISISDSSRESIKSSFRRRSKSSSSNSSIYLIPLDDLFPMRDIISLG